jgi:energy-coupling factor transport system ATP-binding protein
VIELALEGVSFAYAGGDPVLDELDLHVPAGQTLALVGANGCGKTTLVRHLDGLLRPDRGRVLVGGEDAAERSVAELARLVAVCFQQPDRQIFSHSVRDELEFGPRHLGLGDEEAFERAKAALAAVGLSDDLGRHPADLGESERKLLTVASVLAMDTPVLVLDEPTTGLDAPGVERVTGIIADLHARGRTVIAISHDMRFVAESFERVVALEHGTVVLDGSPTEVFAEEAWPSLRCAGLEPPEAARIGARAGLGSTPTEGAIAEAITLARGGR